MTMMGLLCAIIIIVALDYMILSLLSEVILLIRINLNILN
jgi:hypothetical protein